VGSGSARYSGDLDITRTDAFDRYFQANIAGHGELANAQATLTVDKGVNYIKTKAVASAVGRELDGHGFAPC